MTRGLAIALLVPGAIGIAVAQAGGRDAGGMPNFDVGASCSGSTFPDCRSQEQIARDLLAKEWSRFTAQDKATCTEDARMAGPPSYIEWLTCLQTQENLRKFSATQNSGMPAATTGSDTSGSHRSRRHTHSR
jgi:hypothetical protein